MLQIHKSLHVFAHQKKQNCTIDARFKTFTQRFRNDHLLPKRKTYILHSNRSQTKNGSHLSEVCGINTLQLLNLVQLLSPSSTVCFISHLVFHQK